MTNESQQQASQRDYRMVQCEGKLQKFFDGLALEPVVSLTQRDGKFATVSFIVYLHEVGEPDDDSQAPGMPSFAIVTPEPDGAPNA